jgi:DNA-directed RNA polymerase subunit omega
MRNKEGLRYPSIDNLLTKIDSTAIDPKCSKPVGIALEEILEGKVQIDFEETK